MQSRGSSSSAGLRRPSPKPRPEPEETTPEEAVTEEAVTEETAPEETVAEEAAPEAAAPAETEPQTEQTEQAEQTEQTEPEIAEPIEEAGKPKPVGSKARRGTETISYPPQSEMSGAETKSEPADPAEAQDKPVRLRGAAIITVIAVLLGGFAVFAGIAGANAGANLGDNTAIVDNKTTTQVKQQATNALNTMFSFDYKNPDKTKNEAKSLILGKVSSQYDQLMQVLRDNGAKNQLSLSSAVLSIGVQRIEGNRSRVLALMSQTYSKGGGKGGQQIPTLGMIRADLEFTNNAWKVSGLKMLSS